jgi:hypothetical protein
VDGDATPESAGNEHDDGDLSFRPSLVVRIAAIGADDAWPQLGPFRRVGGVRPHRPGRAADGELDVRVGDEIAVPLGVTVIAATLRRDEHDPLRFVDRVLSA